ncbi:MAG: peptidoglycan DD-metalloendopeptidase family protein [Flavobacteriaceae bacterium]|nr:peptidoglycan DD-metalloendopeptidase family protein [Flavobacteriaceae bacterium]
MKLVKLFLLIVIISVFFNIENTHAQTRKQLEAQRKELQRKIAEVNKLLFAAQKSEKNALEALKDINQKIAVRTAYINSINKEASALTRTIRKNQQQIDKLTKELAVLKKDYAEMIYKSYKSKSKQGQLLFLMSSQSFQQAYKRLQYMKQYTQHRKRQGKEIETQSLAIKKLNDSLLYKKQVKDTLIAIEKTQKQEIESDKKNKEKLVAQIKRKERKYIREIRTAQKEERKIAAKIDKIIKDAIAKSNGANNKKSTSFALTPEAKALAKRFESNKGKLPWPVKSGFVVRRYGKQAHPTLRGITITSTGLHIATEKGATANSVFNGKVLAVQLLTGGKKALLVQHGNYISTYNNLESLLVKKGDNVVTGQPLGKIFTNKVTGKTILIFVIHKEINRQNPATWLLKR